MCERSVPGTETGKRRYLDIYVEIDADADAET